MTDPGRGKALLLAGKNGTDGYPWTVALRITAVDTGVSPALGGGGASPVRTTVALELYQDGDDS